jgi:ESS family glutamate:Na+ symporter
VGLSELAAVNRRAVEGLGGLAIDGIVICAIGTLSLSALGHNVGPLVILADASVAWSVVLVLVIGRRVFELDWFEHSIAEFGEGQGNVATGFMMVDMVDPTRLPLIAALGLPIFTILAVVSTVGLTIWGMRRAAPGGSALQRAS